MKPWHLHSEAERDRVLTCLAVEADWQIHHYQGHNRDYSDALRAAAAVLRDAAPAYPDDCPAFAVDLGAGEEHVEICNLGGMDAAGRVWVTLTAPYGWREPIDCVVSALRPLTPAAAEFLAALGGGE